MKRISKTDVKNRKAIFLILGLSFFCLSAGAQDSARKKEVNITSTFKPTLKEAAKINFNATPPAADTTVPGCNTKYPIKIYRWLSARLPETACIAGGHRGSLGK